jgi:hypothetical protein
MYHGSFFPAMHVPLNPHLHSDKCNEIIFDLMKCHQETRFGSIIRSRLVVIVSTCELVMIFIRFSKRFCWDQIFDVFCRC